MAKDTCGIIIKDSTNRILICRPHGIKGLFGWTIPKGKCEGEETTLEAALRETKEETGMDVSGYPIEFLGERIYSHKKKRLVCYYIELDFAILTERLTCSTFSEHGNPEIDHYEMVDIGEAIMRVHETQAFFIKKLYEKIRTR
jgi:8-oxo-dGTP pyrophosphatase MutT (NUDIX family)